MLPQVVLHPQRAGPILRRHPWVRDSAVARVKGDVADGDEVDVFSDRGVWLARGLYNGRSRIRVRLYTWRQEQPLDDAFWRRRLETAVNLRRTLGCDDEEGAARLVFSEGDGFSGLIVDRYAKHAVVQATSLAIAQRLERLIPMLVELVSPASVTVRTDPGTASREGLALAEGPRWGEPEETVYILEHGVRYGVRLLGQKTGFYLDQRENRRVAAALAAGRRVLDMCCYTGGFALAAARIGGAAEVIGVDTSETAIAQAKINADLNGLANVRFETGDCFGALEQRVAVGEQYGMVVLDPPKFTRGRGGVNDALRAYHRLNALAVRLLEPEGILVTCSCSGGVRREDFLGMLHGVAIKTGRELQVLRQRGAASDHPVAVTCPESEYLKCFVCRVV
jgi:23S rRNA (cytosine1962-C5)-methyltransferase